MDLELPIAINEVPEALRRFVDPEAPEKARMAASRGLVPVKGADLLFVLVQLAFDSNQAISDGARKSLSNLPEAVLNGALEGDVHPAALHGCARIFAERESVLELVVAHANVLSPTVYLVAGRCGERTAERIATNEQRMLASPEIIAALYRNKKTRMSTVDRLIDLAVRNNVRVEGIPSFDAHAQALSGELIPEPSDDGEPLPEDLDFSDTLKFDSPDEDPVEAINVDEADDDKVESVKDEFKPLAIRIAGMRSSQKLRLAQVGNAAARALLVRDRNKQVAMAAISSPQITEQEAAGIARSWQVGEDVLRFIGNKRDWTSSMEVKKALLFNPKTPLGIGIRFLPHLSIQETKELSKSKGVQATLKTAAVARLNKAEKKAKDAKK